MSRRPTGMTIGMLWSQIYHISTQIGYETTEGRYYPENDDDETRVSQLAIEDIKKRLTMLERLLNCGDSFEPTQDELELIEDGWHW